MATKNWNEFDIKRTAVIACTLGNSATTWYSGMIIPAGAIVLGVRCMAPSAVTTTNASATVVLNAGTTALIATTKINALPAETVMTIVPITATGGLYMVAGGELNLVVEGSQNTACTAAYNFYVDYIFA
jgi:ABC-type multidrug transport system permease subunit